MERTLGSTGLVLAVLLASTVARAEGSGSRELGTSARNIFESPQTFFSIHNLTVAAGGGFTDFTDGGTDAITSAGGSWTVRGIFGADQALALEGGYLGAAYPVHTRGGDDGTVFSNGLEAIGRLGYPLRHKRAYAIPYLAGGLGVSFYNTANLSDASGIESTDLVFNVPVGFGIGVGYDRWNFDVRYMYRPGWGASMFDRAAAPGANRGDNNLSFSGLIGYRL
jgi:hypothetical protein